MSTDPINVQQLAQASFAALAEGDPERARDGFERLNEVAQRFLDVTLEYAGFIPRDRFLVKADAKQQAVSELYPGADASLAFRKLAETVDKWPMPNGPSGNLEFFVDRMMQPEALRGVAV